jgi:hypothetical protein
MPDPSRIGLKTRDAKFSKFDRTFSGLEGVKPKCVANQSLSTETPADCGLMVGRTRRLFLGQGSLDVLQEKNQLARAQFRVGDARFLPGRSDKSS